MKLNTKKMAWFKRKKRITATEDKMDVPKVFGKSPGKIIDADELERNLFVSPDGFHVRIGSATYFEIFFQQ
jgi:acetyl-CoA carboxylase carboxyl transferase subunit beta